MCICSCRYVTTIGPIAFVNGLSVVASNYAYEYSSVSLTEVIKSATPILVLLISLARGLVPKRNMSWKIAAMFWLAAGVSLTTFSEAAFNPIGVAAAFVAMISSTIRLVLCDILLHSSHSAETADKEDSAAGNGPCCSLL